MELNSYLFKLSHHLKETRKNLIEILNAGDFPHIDNPKSFVYNPKHFRKLVL